MYIYRVHLSARRFIRLVAKTKAEARKLVSDEGRTVRSVVREYPGTDERAMFRLSSPRRKANGRQPGKVRRDWSFRKVPACEPRVIVG